MKDEPQKEFAKLIQIQHLLKLNASGCFELVERS